MKYSRTVKLILPRLQLKLIVAFLALATLALLLQYMLLLSSLASIASELPHDGLLLLDGVGSMLAKVFAITAGVILPLTFFVGLLTTHRFAGPLYRFHIYLRQVIAGEKPPDCKLRKGDELLELCTLINQVTEPLRAETVKVEESPPPPPKLRAAG